MYDTPERYDNVLALKYISSKELFFGNTDDSTIVNLTEDLEISELDEDKFNEAIEKEVKTLEDPVIGPEYIKRKVLDLISSRIGNIRSAITIRSIKNVYLFVTKDIPPSFRGSLITIHMLKSLINTLIEMTELQESGQSTFSEKDIESVSAMSEAMASILSRRTEKPEDVLNILKSIDLDKKLKDRVESAYNFCINNMYSIDVGESQSYQDSETQHSETQYSEHEHSEQEENISELVVDIFRYMSRNRKYSDILIRNLDIVKTQRISKTFEEPMSFMIIGEDDCIKCGADTEDTTDENDSMDNFSDVSAIENRINKCIVFIKIPERSTYLGIGININTTDLSAASIESKEILNVYFDEVECIRTMKLQMIY
jgi:hypothetical protein